MLKRKFLLMSIAALIAIGASSSALAHDGWSQTNAPIVAQGETTYIDLLFGNHSNEHRSYRIDGQWSTNTSKVFVMNPAGVKKDITSTRFYTGEPATPTAPARNNGFIASFSAASPGAYIISVEADSIFKSATSSSRTFRSAKSFVAVSDIPLLERVSALRGFSKAVSPDRAELIPLFNPAAVKPNQTVGIQLLMKGQPLANTKVSVIRRSDNTNIQDVTTDALGKVTFMTGPADYYLVRAKPSTNESKEGEYSVTNYEATMTFTVQNGSAALVNEAVNAAPLVYLNGKLMDRQRVKIVNGSAQADAALVKQLFNVNVAEGKSTPLRTIAEQQGATIEFLNAVGGNRAAIHIYK